MIKYILVVFVIIFGLGWLVSQGGYDSLSDPGYLPNNPLYGVKLVREGVETFLIGGSERLVRRHVKVAGYRLIEASLMANQGELSLANEALDRYDKNLTSAEGLVREAKIDTLPKLRLTEMVEAVRERDEVTITIIRDKIGTQVVEIEDGNDGNLRAKIRDFLNFVD